MEVTDSGCSQLPGQAGVMNVRDDRQTQHLRQWPNK